MNVAFLLWLDLVRDRAKVPFVITSSWRDNPYSLHGRGCAVDLHSRIWSAVQKWRVAEAVVFYASQAPGKVELELVYNVEPGADCHWHIGVDDGPGKEHELVEMDE